jgi:site-specific recombinase XerD
MDEFKAYLQTRYRYTNLSLHIKIQQVVLWKKYESSGQSIETMNLPQLLKIIEILRKQYAIITLNHQIYTLKTYYFFLIEKGIRTNNPLEKFRIKSEKSPILQGFLTSDEMDFIYENYPKSIPSKNDLYRQRNKIMLGLLIYQGLDTGTLGVLQITNIDLEKAQITIPKTTDKKLNPRILPLYSVQIMALHDYLSQTREKLIDHLKLATCDLLFPRVENTKMKSMIRTLKPDIETYFAIQNLHQFRISRIAIWLKTCNIREVQYKSGYKFLSSLEKYNQSQLESLKEAVAKYHTF